MDTTEEVPDADHVFDGGAMDCGSGLILLIRQHMLQVPSGGVLEIQSSEPTVETELPPWCRMVGHVHLKTIKNSEGTWRHWVQRGTDDSAAAAELESDQKKAQQFKWNLRARRTAEMETTTYSRNFSWKTARSVDFDRSGNLPSSLEHFFGALLADVINCFTVRCSRNQILLDELEGTLNGTLNNSLAAVGIEDGDPSISEIKIVMYVTSPATSEDIQQQWTLALSDSTVYQTLMKSCVLDAKLVFI